MDVAAFAEPSGSLVATDGGAAAFVPKPLPGELDWPGPLVAALDAASGAVGELAGIGRIVRNPRLLISPYVRREAVLSSRIEGTQSTIADVYAAEAGQVELFHETDVREVVNYVNALEHGLASSLPISKRLIRDLHAALMRGVRGGEQRPGEFRRSQNWVGPIGCSLAEATYVPPPAHELEPALDALETFVHASRLPALIIAGLVHYQFEAIHPFSDGNGRVGRLLIPLILQDRGVLPQPLLYVSAYFERSRDEYYERLFRVSAESDWNAWLIYFLDAVKAQATEAVADSDRLVALEQRYREQLTSAKARGTAQSLIDHLFVNPYITARRAREALGVTDPAARGAIQTLEAAGILREVTGRRYGRRWLAPEILDAVRGPRA